MGARTLANRLAQRLMAQIAADARRDCVVSEDLFALRGGSSQRNADGATRQYSSITAGADALQHEALAAWVGIAESH